MDADTSATAPAITEWTRPVLAEINDKAQYLVLTNWRDGDIDLFSGLRVRHMMADRVVRGRPVLIARVIKPKEK